MRGSSRKDMSGTLATPPDTRAQQQQPRASLDERMIGVLRMTQRMTKHDGLLRCSHAQEKLPIPCQGFDARRYAQGGALHREQFAKKLSLIGLAAKTIAPFSMHSTMIDSCRSRSPERKGVPSSQALTKMTTFLSYLEKGNACQKLFKNFNTSLKEGESNQMPSQVYGVCSYLLRHAGLG
eukprot:5969992-Pleurochrysis_carterae.AAC.5